MATEKEITCTQCGAHVSEKNIRCPRCLKILVPISCEECNKCTNKKCKN